MAKIIRCRTGSRNWMAVILYSTAGWKEELCFTLEVTGEHIGARWRIIRTSTTPWKKNDNSTKQEEVRALHLECDSVSAQYVKHKVARLYSSTGTLFPDGTKMHLIPTVSSIISQASKEKYGLVIAKQAAFVSKLCAGTSWEFSQNLLLDYTPWGSRISLWKANLNIKSMKFLENQYFTPSIPPGEWTMGLTLISYLRTKLKPVCS
jgi:hypothetical protein